MKYVTVQDAATVLGVTDRTIRYRIETGLMNADRIGRAWLIPVKELAKLEGAERPKRGPKPMGYTGRKRGRTPKLASTEA